MESGCTSDDGWLAIQTTDNEGCTQWDKLIPPQNLPPKFLYSSDNSNVVWVNSSKYFIWKEAVFAFKVNTVYFWLIRYPSLFFPSMTSLICVEKEFRRCSGKKLRLNVHIFHFLIIMQLSRQLLLISK